MTVRPSNRRGTTSKNAQGNSEDRRRRKAWLVKTFRADVDLYDPANPREHQSIRARSDHPQYVVPVGEGLPACRCYRCGILLTTLTVSPDRIKPGCMGGTYAHHNIRPACDLCQMRTGGQLGAARKSAKRSRR